jgi:hypothetical protein
MTTSREGADEVEAIVDRIRPILAGNPPELVGGVLADLFAIWLAGHFDVGGRTETAALREALIAQWLETARKLIKPNEQMILERTRRESH